MIDYCAGFLIFALRLCLLCGCLLVTDLLMLVTWFVGFVLTFVDCGCFYSLLCECSRSCFVCLICGNVLTYGLVRCCLICVLWVYLFYDCCVRLV